MLVCYKKKGWAAGHILGYHHGLQVRTVAASLHVLRGQTLDQKPEHRSEHPISLIDCNRPTKTNIQKQDQCEVITSVQPAKVSGDHNQLCNLHTFSKKN